MDILFNIQPRDCYFDSLGFLCTSLWVTVPCSSSKPNPVTLPLHGNGIFPSTLPAVFMCPCHSCAKHCYSSLGHNIGNIIAAMPFNPPSGAASYKLSLPESRDDSSFTQNVLFMTESKGGCENNATLLQWTHRETVLAMENKKPGRWSELGKDMMHSLKKIIIM